ncbi:PDDEXK nuclease domain-containing protein [Variovorax sp. J22G21]|uniref:PDDEXK nuclease domain-containing protein n=1 Tax=Variovorax fucosicus TaxID=3053517 RepID=UPI0025792081|nr:MULTISPECIES: PDDEXK nuclease domain-containing protein [unclassified Variovorax]MDM0038661.1 PDDEXK nuclease domain-containing protein [Variovorax sp. J22R193]MDM0055733.1 PDDEXK nuclease domain-containing protein [Variovorax sp. J22G47]MDM0063437.1 PDDEXK nuclease domain-containing protein [Variovorax sp. J22G21]
MTTSREKKPVAAAPPLYGRVREILDAARAGVARTVNTTQVAANWLVGREIVEEEQRGQRRAGYGARLLAELSARLNAEFGRGYSVDNLEAFRQFYLDYPQLISETVSRKSSAAALALPLEAISGTPSRKSVGDEAWQPGVLHPSLSWSHYRQLLRVGRAEARAFYEIEAIRNAWSVRELSRQAASLLYDRLAKSKDKKGLMRLATHGHEVMQPLDALKDPLVIEFLGLPESPRLVESKLEQALIDNLQTFLLELGKGFAFVSRQERITVDGDHFYIDLVFYHTVLKCYVLIDLKVGKLTHGDLGQIQFYVNYYDRERRTEGDNPTLGVILCPDKNDAVVKYTLGEQQERNIFTSRYQLHLPTEQELERELRRELRQLSSGA